MLKQGCTTFPGTRPSLLRQFCQMIAMATQGHFEFGEKFIGNGGGATQLDQLRKMMLRCRSTSRSPAQTRRLAISISGSPLATSIHRRFWGVRLGPLATKAKRPQSGCLFQPACCFGLDDGARCNVGCSSFFVYPPRVHPKPYSAKARHVHDLRRRPGVLVMSHRAMTMAIDICPQQIIRHRAMR